MGCVRPLRELLSRNRWMLTGVILQHLRRVLRDDRTCLLPVPRLADQLLLANLAIDRFVLLVQANRNVHHLDQLRVLATCRQDHREDDP